MSQTYLQCVGALGLLSGGLAFKMSLFRLAGSPGENEPESPLNKWHLTQSLAAEWNPVAVGLLLALALKDDKSDLARYAALILTASRFTFATKLLAPKEFAKSIGYPSMMATYATTFLLSAKLVLDY